MNMNGAGVLSFSQLLHKPPSPYHKSITQRPPPPYNNKLPPLMYTANAPMTAHSKDWNISLYNDPVNPFPTKSTPLFYLHLLLQVQTYSRFPICIQSNFNFDGAQWSNESRKTQASVW